VKRVAFVAFAVLAISIAVLGYGYWFGLTHGALSIDVTDVSDRDHPHPAQVAIVLSDAHGRSLAEAHAGDPIGTVYLSSPVEYACRDVEERASFSVEARQGWSRCFARQSRWIPTWVRSVASVDLRSGPCSLRNVPVSVSAFPDTRWLWWVPLPHIGGRPYTWFRVPIRIDLAHCVASP
jgi:hypothetical protein